MSKKAKTEAERIDAWRVKLLHALEDTVPFDGWSEKALRHAARKAAMSDVELLRAFPDGIEEALAAFLLKVDTEIADSLTARKDWSDLGMTARIKAALMTRFEVASKNKEMFRQLIAYYAVPWRAPVATERMYKTVDDMWYMAGDAATDFNFYTKRMLLAGVYSATLMFWLNQTEDNPKGLEAFIDRRLSDVLTIPKLKSKVSAQAEDMKQRMEDCSAFMPHRLGETFSRALANWRLGS